MFLLSILFFLFFFNDTATTEIYTLSLHDALPIFHHSAERIERGLGHGLGHGRVRMNRELDLFHSVFILPRYRQLMDDLGRVSPHDVGAQDLAVLLVAQDLHEPFGLTGSTRPAVGRERKPARYVVDLPFLALILGEADAGHLRMAVGHTGHVVVPDRDRKSTRLNSSHDQISYAVFCLKKKKKKQDRCFCEKMN